MSNDLGHPPKREGRRKKERVSISDKRLRFTRDGVLFVSGLIGIGYETLVSQTDRPTLLLLFGAMIGLPAFLNKDEKDQEKSDEQPK